MSEPSGETPTPSLAPRFVFAALVVALALLGCTRPLLPSPIRESWGGILAALAAAASVVQVFRARRAELRHELWLWALLPPCLLALYLQPQRVASDGIFYYAPLRSIVVDGDLDFENEYRVLGAEPGYFQRTVTGRLPNTWSVGPAILWSPFYLAAHGLALTGLFRPTGFGYPYFTAVATGTALIGFAGVLSLFRLARSYFEPSIAFVSVLLVWLATFHVWYMVFEPSMSHALAMASVSGFFLYAHRGVQGARGFASMGALGGVVALVRWQNVLYLPVALLTSWAAHGRPKWRELLVGGAAFGLVFSPQLLYWRALYGSFFLVPQGGGFLDWASPELEAVLFSSRHGLFPWAPVLALGAIGLPGFVRRAPVLGGALVASGLAMLWVNASVHDWWAGASFGSRRFDGALPALALGLGVSVASLRRRVERRPLAALGVALSAFVLWNGAMMGVYFAGAVPPDGPASFRQVAADGLELVYRHTGYPFSWPGALRDWLLHGRPPPVYDLSGSHSLANNVDIRMGETDALHLGRGWSLPRREPAPTSRTPSPSGGEIYVALREPAPYTLEVEGTPGASLLLVWNERRLGRLRLGERGRGEMPVSAAAVRSGMNRLLLVPDPDPRARIGISRVSLRRPGEPADY